MTGIEVMAVVRQRIADTKKLNYPDDEPIKQNINTAIRYLSQILIARHAPEMIVSETVANISAVPDGFYGFVGEQPLYREGNVLRTYSGNSESVRYWCMAKGLNSLAEDIPFSDDYADALITGASMLCLNKDEFDVGFEQNLMSSITAMLPGSSGS